LKLRTLRWGAALFFLLFAFFVTWPGMIPFNRIHPLVLGLPFSMAWIGLWVVLSFLVLLWIDHAEKKAGGHED
jgi:hypothetical protein